MRAIRIYREPVRSEKCLIHLQDTRHFRLGCGESEKISCITANTLISTYLGYVRSEPGCVNPVRVRTQLLARQRKVILICITNENRGGTPRLAIYVTSTSTAPNWRRV